ncbi:MAG: hypothetical protein AAGG55_05690 [Pseudomonadota bacterium]
MFDLVVTCKPAHRAEDFLDINPALSAARQAGLDVKLVNHPTEVPEEVLNSAGYSLVSVDSPRRPSFAEMVNAASSDWIVIANSDVWFSGDIEGIVRALVTRNVRFGAARRIDLPGLSNFAPVSLNEIATSDSKTALIAMGKVQSRRTIDFFLMQRIASKTLVSMHPDLGKHPMGTVGVDDRFLQYTNESFHLCDLTQSVEVLHPNHESFREIFRGSVLLSMSEREKFVTARAATKSESRIDQTLACLSVAEFRAANGTIAPRKSAQSHILKPWLRRMESLRVRLENQLELFVYRWNRFVISLSPSSEPSLVMGRFLCMLPFSRQVAQSKTDRESDVGMVIKLRACIRREVHRALFAERR